MYTFQAETSNVHISTMKSPNIMMLYLLESYHVALLRPSIFIIQNLVLQNRSLGSPVGTIQALLL